MNTRLLSILIFSMGCSFATSGQENIQERVEISLPNSVAYAPTISGDGNTLIFQRQNEKAYELVECRSENGKWVDYKPIRIFTNSGFDSEMALIGGPSLSFDGNTLYFFRDNNGSDLLYSKRTEIGWSVAEAIPYPVKSAGYEGFPSVSPDETALYFVRQNLNGPKSAELKKEGHKFCLSIFVSRKNESGTWGNPVALPYPINKDCEKSPKILVDGKTLLFSSNRPGGKGGYDIYRSLLDNSGNWGYPEPLDFLNTAQDDQLPSVDANMDRIYFTHNNNEIRSIPIPDQFRSKPVAFVKGIVRNKETDQGMVCQIQVQSRYSQKKYILESGIANGSYTFVLPLNDFYEVTFSKEGYGKIYKTYDLLKESTAKTIIDDIQLELIQNPINQFGNATVLPIARSNVSVGKKVALVIGIKSYTNVPPLLNTINDARSVSESLKTKGFETIELYDPKNKAEIRDAVIKYSRSLKDQKDGVGLLFYAGHGMQVDGSNYIIPTNANLELKADVEDQCMNLDYVLRTMEENGNHLNIMILDACRNNPFRGFSRSGEQGLSMVAAPKGSYLVYATKPGSVASDGVGSNGLFTSKLLKYMNTPNLNIEQVFKLTASEVAKDSDDRQRPWISSDYTGDFFFFEKK